MAKGQGTTVLSYLRRLAAPQKSRALMDGPLLEQFATQHDETAFAALLERHGPLVWGLCRSMLHDLQDAEDAFQATFLVLVRKAGSIGKPESLASWLYGVAYRIAARARAQAARRQARERQGIEMDAPAPMGEADWHEWAPTLHEEVQRLPEKFRTPLVLCYLQGKSRAEAAQQLGWTEGAVKGMLERARELLRSRLLRRGLVLSPEVLATAARANGSAAVPAPLAHTIIQAALLTAAGRAAAAGVISARVAALTEGALKVMLLTKLTLAAIVLTVGVLATSAGVLTYGALVPPGTDQQVEKPPKAGSISTEVRTNVVNVPSPRGGVLRLIGTEIKADEKVPPAQTVTLTEGKDVKRYRRLREGDRVETGQLLARLDDRLARDDVAIRKAKVTAAEADLRAAELLRDEAQERWNKQIRLHKAGTTSDEDLRGAKLAFGRYSNEAISKRGAVDVAKLELNQAQTILEMHEIRSPVAGVIQTIFKHPGEAVKSLETSFRIRVTDNPDR